MVRADDSQDSDSENDCGPIYENLPRSSLASRSATRAATRQDAAEDNGGSGSSFEVLRKTADELGEGWESETSDEDDNDNEDLYASVVVSPGGTKHTERNTRPPPKPKRQPSNIGRPQCVTNAQQRGAACADPDEEDIFGEVGLARRPNTDSMRHNRARMSSSTKAKLGRRRSIINGHGFIATLLSETDFHTLWSCISQESRKLLQNVFRCVPMAAHELEVTLQITASPDARRVAGIAVPIAKTLSLINYYYVGTERLDTMRASFDALISSAPVRQLCNRLERLARSHGNMCMATRIIGRSNITRGQLDVCLEALEQAMGASKHCSDISPLGDLSTAFWAHNMLFRTTQIMSVTGFDFYLRNLQIMSEGSHEQLRLICTEQRATTDAQVFSDAAFLLSAGAAIEAFSRELQKVYYLTLFHLEQLSETLYLAYMQMPGASRDLTRINREICVVLESPWHETCAMRLVATQLIKFLRKANETGLWICPTFWKFAISQMVLRTDGGPPSAKTSVDAATGLLDSQDLFDPETTEEDVKNMMLRTLIVTKLGKTGTRGRRVLTTDAQIEDVSPLIRHLVRSEDSDENTTSCDVRTRTPEREHRSLSSAIGGMFRAGNKKKIR